MSYNVIDIYRQVILEHSKYPKNYGKIESKYVLEMLNPSCGDKIVIYMDILENTVKDIKFEGEGCSISMASASMMTEEIKGYSIEQAKEKIENFLNMITGEEFNKDLLEDSISLENISNLPARVKCATLSWKILEKIIENKERDKDE